VHFLRNALDHLPRKADDDCLQELRWHSGKAIRRGGRSELAAWIAKWSMRFPRLVGRIGERIEETLIFVKELAPGYPAPIERICRII
jgi:putative transposase